MKKTILITGATDGIGLETARKLSSLGHNVVIHGRNPDKLQSISSELGVDFFRADLSSLSETKILVKEVLQKYDSIDVLINNAGVFKTNNPLTQQGLDVRFVVNTFSPYILSTGLIPILGSGRIINLSSAAQASVEMDAMVGKKILSDLEAYAQSKLAIAMWSKHLADELGESGPIVISVNPASLLGTKMVKEGFNTSGNDIGIGVQILVDLAIDDVHQKHSGEYFDNDIGRYSTLSADGADTEKGAKIVEVIKGIV